MTLPPHDPADPSTLWAQNEKWTEPAARAAGLSHGMLLRPAAPPERVPLAQVYRDSRAALDWLAGGGLAGLTLVSMHQVHGDHLEVLASEDDLARAKNLNPSAGAPRMFEFPAADALATNLRGVGLVVKTADCVPILLWDPAARVIAAAHCGWRGLAARLAEKTAQSAVALGARAERLEAWIAPCICERNYEVSAEMIDQFRRDFPGAEVSPGGRMLDLKAVARHQLVRAGLAARNIALSPLCTFEEERLHSYRREGDAAGRLLTVIALAPAAARPAANQS